MKERMDSIQDMRRKIEEKANVDLRAAERKSRKETETVLQRVQSLEQDLKLVQNKVANMDGKMDSVLDLLRKIQEANSTSSTKTDDDRGSREDRCEHSSDVS